MSSEDMDADEQSGADLWYLGFLGRHLSYHNLGTGDDDRFEEEGGCVP